MTRTQYGVKVTSIIDEQTGHSFDYADSFEADVDACFTQRMTPEAAAEKLLKDYTSDVA